VLLLYVFAHVKSLAWNGGLLYFLLIIIYDPFQKYPIQGFFFFPLDCF
jgi:hypothetical protein